MDLQDLIIERFNDLSIRQIKALLILLAGEYTPEEALKIIGGEND